MDRERVRYAIDRLSHVLPGQAPLQDFVHHNTVHGFQHLPFPEAMAEVRRVTGMRGYLPESRFRDFFSRGRIDASDIDAVIGSEVPDADAVLVGGVRIRDVCRAAMLHDLDPLPSATLRWRAREPGLLAPAGLWRAAHAVFGLDEATSRHVRPVPPSLVAVAWPELAGRLGREWTLRGLLHHLTGEDILEAIRPSLMRHLASHLDQGMASWPNPDRQHGFWRAWRESARVDLVWWLDGLPGMEQELGELAENPLDAISAELTYRELDAERWVGYLERLSLELPGWSGMFLWRHQHPGHEGIGVAVDMADYLAVRLVLERLYAGELTRRRWQVAPRPQELAAIPLMVSQPEPWPVVCTHVWPLFALARALDLDAGSIAALDRTAAERILGTLNAFGEERRAYLWLLAYERHYREGILGALVANHGRFQFGAPPKAQVVLCMDDREEGLRRHLEEIDTHLETFGAAAHFNVPHAWLGIDDARAVALAPIVPVPVIPSHEVRELPRQEQAARARTRRVSRHRRWWERLHQGSRLGILEPVLITAIAAPFALVSLLGGVLVPAAMARKVQALKVASTGAVDTCLQFTAPSDTPPGRPEARQLGFKDDEQVDRVQALLRSMGLTSGFASLVAIVGHVSRNRNNPHAAAYNCGACGGRFSGPNARLVSAMANRPEVRARLAERGIDIPEQTWFIGGEHDTCNDQVTWFDLVDLPKHLVPLFEVLRDAMTQACRAHAQERCRRFISAPLSLSPEQALRHVVNRAGDFAQVRPELGHATNACALIGRRNMSRGAFFDRRAFLISYDPLQDPKGEVLERHLLANGAVGAGISLEYYFSTANNERFGSGTKIMHNLVGHLGVMEGSASDLRTGLPQQMIEIHEAMRLLVVVEQKIDLITAIVKRQPALTELVGNGWVIVAAKDPDSARIDLFDPRRGWSPWAGKVDLPTFARAADWFSGQREALAPVLLEAPL
ncbi:MAG: DUF2309 domain-containing protein [Magnetococcales bacterium]|nr:DUF2309 domain-containing protein [Magnetococcales bacterium]